MYVRANNSKDATDIQGNKFYISTENLANRTGQDYRCIVSKSSRCGSTSVATSWFTHAKRLRGRRKRWNN